MFPATATATVDMSWEYISKINLLFEKVFVRQFTFEIESILIPYICSLNRFMILIHMNTFQNSVENITLWLNVILPISFGIPLSLLCCIVLLSLSATSFIISTLDAGFPRRLANSKEASVFCGHVCENNSKLWWTGSSGLCYTIRESSSRSGRHFKKSPVS